jgi:hypothetical protein
VLLKGDDDLDVSMDDRSCRETQAVRRYAC